MSPPFDRGAGRGLVVVEKVEVHRGRPVALPLRSRGSIEIVTFDDAERREHEEMAGIVGIEHDAAIGGTIPKTSECGIAVEDS